MAQNSKYLNGIFATRKDGKYGEFISIGITDEGLKAIQELPSTGSGFRNFSLSPQKNDNNKFSAIKPAVKETSGASDDLPW